MQFILMHRTDAHWESGAVPDSALIARVGAMIGELVRAGAFVGGDDALVSSNQRHDRDALGGVDREVPTGMVLDLTARPVPAELLSGDPPGEPHSHPHRHAPLAHSHPHYPDLHHRHGHREVSPDRRRSAPRSGDGEPPASAGTARISDPPE